MKRNFIFAACAAAAFVFASCDSKEPVNNGGPDNNGGESGDDPEVVLPTEISELTAVADEIEGFSWMDGDQIDVFGLVPTDDPEKPTATLFAYTTTLEDFAESATFVKDEAQENFPTPANDMYVAFYARSAANTTKSRNFQASYALDKEQVAINGLGGFSAAFMVATSQTTEFEFEHASSYVKFEVDDNSTPFTKVTINPVSESEYIVSRIYVDFADEFRAYAQPTNPSTGAAYSQSHKSVSLVNDEGGNFAPATYYIAISPGTYSEGLKITFEDENGNKAEVIKSDFTEFDCADVEDLGLIGELAFAEVPELELATVYEENGKKQGVVYWVDPDNSKKGKIVSVSTVEPIQFTPELIWIVKIESQDSGLANREQYNNATVYTDRKDDFYALKYCEDLRESLGGNWYLPANNELKTLYSAYYGLTGSLTNKTDYRVGNPNALVTKSAYDAALGLLGETTTATLDGDADGDGVSDNDGFGAENGVTYWSSKINTGGAVQYVTFGVFNNGNNAKDMTQKYYVRCIRDVELQ